MISLKEYLNLNAKCPFYAEDYPGIEDDKAAIREYNKALCEKYTWLIPTNRFSGKKITDCGDDGEEGFFPGSPGEHPSYNYEYTELDEMPSGWRLAFGEQICQEIQDELQKFDFDHKYRITQIKEKYGALRWYDEGHPIGKFSNTYDIVKTDDWSELTRNKSEDDYYEYIGKDIDENHTMMYKHYKILEHCKLGEIISKYEKLSETICIRCGAPAEWETTGWISPYCTSCKEFFESKERFYDNFIPIKEDNNDEEEY